MYLRDAPGRILLGLLLVLGGAGAQKPILKLAADGSFKIAMFCDLHYGESIQKDFLSDRFQRTLLGLETPSLVVIDGDASSNYFAPSCALLPQVCKDWFLVRWRQFTAPMEQLQVPYAYTLGNHDRIPGIAGRAERSADPGNETEYMVPDHWIMQQDMTNLHSLTVDGPSDIHGASNYVVPILGSDGKPAAYVWLLDSSDDHCLGKTGWGCVYPDQVKWFRDTAKRLKEEDGRVVPGIMFHHIPLDEVNTAWNNLSIEINGSRGEPVCCASVNTGLFDAILEAGNIWGVFHGHDHNNDFVALYKGVHLGFGRKSGYGGYGGDVASQRGSRIFELRQGADGTVSWETWIREEAGARVEQQKLSFRLPGPAACCGTIELNQEYISGLFERRLEEGSSSLEEDRRACRAQDDAGACRRAAGQEQAISV